MKRNSLISCLALLLTGLSYSCGSEKNQEVPEQTTIFACGDDKVVMLSVHHETLEVDTLWSWVAHETENLPESYLPMLRSMDECKPSPTGDTLLLTSSSAGVVLLERKTKKALFYAMGPNAHSAEFLPNNRIIVANSITQGGNSIELYDVSRPEEVLFRDTLYSGHGAVWLEGRQRLYVIGMDELKSYSLENWDSENPALKHEKTWELPDIEGHDLSIIDENQLLLSTEHSVWTFEIDQEEFLPFTPLENIRDVKSANYNRNTGQLVYTKAEESWWTFNIYMAAPEKVIHIPSIRLYKVRVL